MKTIICKLCGTLHHNPLKYPYCCFNNELKKPELPHITIQTQNKKRKEE